MAGRGERRRADSGVEGEWRPRLACPPLVPRPRSTSPSPPYPPPPPPSLSPPPLHSFPPPCFSQWLHVRLPRSWLWRLSVPLRTPCLRAGRPGRTVFSDTINDTMRAEHDVPFASKTQKTNDSATVVSGAEHQLGCENDDLTTATAAAKSQLGGQTDDLPAAPPVFVSRLSHFLDTGEVR